MNSGFDLFHIPLRNVMLTRSKTEYAPLTQRSPTKIQRLFVGIPDLHRRYNRRLQVAARKLSAEPKVQRLLRAKCVNRVALDVQLSRHGRRCASAEFLRPCRDFSQYRSPLGYVSTILKTFVEGKRQSRILGVRHYILHGGGKPEGKEGVQYFQVEEREVC